jgi:hypothetical protein
MWTLYFMATKFEYCEVTELAGVVDRKAKIMLD